MGNLLHRKRDLLHPTRGRDVEKQIFPRGQHAPGTISSTEMVLCRAALARLANLVQTRAQRRSARPRFYQVKPAASTHGIGRSARFRPFLYDPRLYENQRRSLVPPVRALAHFELVRRSRTGLMACTISGMFDNLEPGSSSRARERSDHPWLP